MTLLTTVFRMSGASDYRRLHRVWEHSARKVMPDANIVTLDLGSVNGDNQHKPSITANRRKMDAWAEYFVSCDDDVVLMDCDMIVRRDFNEPFRQYEFDIAITKRDMPGASMPINGGVVMVRNTKAAHEFMQLWRDTDERLYRNKREHERWRKRYHGMNQASLGCVFNTENHEAKIQRLPCSKYNACEKEWALINKLEPYAIHCKANLKRSVLSDTPVGKMNPRFHTAARIWRDLEQEALRG